MGDRVQRQIELATRLLDHLLLEEEPLQLEDLLDDLATAGLRLENDENGLSSEAYQRVMSEAAKLP